MADILDPTIGSLAPNFNLPASSGIDIALSNFRTINKVYLFFVREFN